MKNKKLTVTIGIPAYNEEHNIIYLLNKILSQKETYFIIKQIIVVSDASTDNTDRNILDLKNSKITLIRNKKRKGQISAQNKIFKMADTDVVVLFEADTMPVNNLFIDELLKPIAKNNKIGMVQGNKTPLSPRNIFEKAISIQGNIYRECTFKNPITRNVFCTGRSGRAFSKLVYKKLVWPISVPEDSYALLWCRQNNIKTTVQTSAVCYYRAPHNLEDLIKERQKIFSAKNTLLSYFPKEFIEKVYERPKHLIFTISLQFFISHPILFIFYMLMKWKVESRITNKNFSDLWATTPSTKILSHSYKTNISISVGIPAYNEEKNIKRIIQSVLHQEENNFFLKEIIVVSDGSSDKTIEKAREIKESRITLIAEKERKGKSTRLNQIFSRFKGDVLFIIDADTMIKDTHLFESILKQSHLERDGLISVEAVPLSGSSFFEKCVNYNVRLQMDVRRKWKKGCNYLAFRGVFLGLDGNFARKIVLPETLVNNDTYFYFLARSYNFMPRYLPKLKVYYKSPVSFHDHLLQSTRFQSSKQELRKFVPLDETEYVLPTYLVLKALIKFFIMNPIYFSAYLYILIKTRIARNKAIDSRWTVASSTKRIALE